MTEPSAAEHLNPIIDKLARIDERTMAMAAEVTKIKEVMVTKELLESKIGPVQRLVYGAVGIVLLAVLGALLAQVIAREGSKQVPVFVPVTPAPSAVHK